MCLQLGIFLYGCGMHSFVISFGVIYQVEAMTKRKALFCCLGYSWYKNAHDRLFFFLGNVNSPNCYGSVQITYADAPFSMSCSQQKAEWNKDTKMASSSDGSFSYISDYLTHSPIPSNTVGRGPSLSLRTLPLHQGLYLHYILKISLRLWAPSTLFLT